MSTEGWSDEERRALASEREAFALQMRKIDRFLKKLANEHQPWAMEWDDAVQWARLWGCEAVLSYRPGKGSLLNWVHLKVTSRFKDHLRREAFRRRAVSGEWLDLSVAEGLPDRDRFPQVLAGAVVEGVMKAAPPSAWSAPAVARFLAGEPLTTEEENYWPAFRSWVTKARRAVDEGPLAGEREEESALRRTRDEGRTPKDAR